MCGISELHRFDFDLSGSARVKEDSGSEHVRERILFKVDKLAESVGDTVYNNTLRILHLQVSPLFPIQSVCRNGYTFLLILFDISDFNWLQIIFKYGMLHLYIIYKVAGTAIIFPG